MITIEVHDIIELKRRAAGFEALFDRKPTIYVSGTFDGDDGNLVFARSAEVQSYAREWLTAAVQGEIVRMRPSAVRREPISVSME